MRKEFPKPVKRAALLRSGGLCEGEGNRDLAYGVHFDHVNADSNGGKPTLENCAAVCPHCNMHKAYHHDTPRAAKLKRQSDKDKGIRTRKSAPIPGSKASGLRKRMDGTVERRT